MDNILGGGDRALLGADPARRTTRRGAGPGRGRSITYGSSVIGSLTAESPFVIYTFNANPGDLISLVLAGLAPEVVPESSLLGPDQRQLALTSNDPFSVGSQLARLDYRIMQGGIHSLIVNNANNTPGEFLLLLNGRPGGEATGIAVGSTQTANLPPNTAPGLFSFPASPDSPLTLSLSTSTAGFSFLARVYDPTGNLIAGLAGEALRGVSLNVAPGSGQYVVEIGSLTPNVQGAIMVALTQGSASQPVTGPVTTEEPAEPAGPPRPAYARPPAPSTSTCAPGRAPTIRPLARWPPGRP